MTIGELTSCTPEQYRQLEELIRVLDPDLPLKPEVLDELLQSGNSHLMVMQEDGKIIGCYTYCLFVSPTGRKATIEDVALHPEWQGRHLGQELVTHAIQQLREWSPVHVELTSRPHRVSANALYRKLGFTHKDTNFYYMDLQLADK